MTQRPAIRSGDAVFSFDAQLVIQTWNEATERLTGIPAEEALGQPCWLVLGATSPRGDVVCHAGCSSARLARDGWPVAAQELNVRAEGRGRIPVHVSTVRVEQEQGPLFLHMLTEQEVPATPASVPASGGPKLSSRQQEVLALIAAGHTALVIAEELGLAESTVRNHIGAVLLAFRAHSQLEAVAKARACGALTP